MPASAAWFCPALLPKPMPGSSTMRARNTPAASASASVRSKKRRMSPCMSTLSSRSARLCMSTAAAPLSATTCAIAGSFCRPHTSLTIAAPCLIAARATAALEVSMEIGSVQRAASAATIGSTRRSSSASGTGVAPGRVDSPPMSRLSAPSAAMRSA